MTTFADGTQNGVTLLCLCTFRIITRLHHEWKKLSEWYAVQLPGIYNNYNSVKGQAILITDQHVILQLFLFLLHQISVLNTDLT